MSRLTLLLGEASEVLRAYPENCVDAIVTDPPSGTGMIMPFRQSSDTGRYVEFDSPLGRSRYSFGNQLRFNKRFRTLFVRDVWPVLKQSGRLLKPGGYGIFWVLQRSAHWLAWGLEEAGMSVLDILVVEVPAKRMKSPIVDGCKSTQVVQRTETWLLARKPGEETASQTAAKWGTGYMRFQDGDARVSNLTQGFRFKHETEHPSEKSVGQMRGFVRLVTPEGGVVLDPFMGSGSTGVAALQESRKFLGVERDPKWFAVASGRATEDINPVLTVDDYMALMEEQGHEPEG